MKFMVIIASAMSFISLIAVNNDDHNEAKSFFDFVKSMNIDLTSMGVGAVSGGVEVLVDQPLITLKNYWQARGANANAQAPRTLADFYRGFNANMLGMVPTTALQMLAYDNVNALVQHKEDSLYKSWTPVTASGFAGAIAASPIELIVIQQQKHKTTMKQTLRFIYKEQGIAKLLGRGFIATALRDTGFSKGVIEGQPYVKEKLMTTIPSMPSGAASLISGCGVGAVVAFVTHPLDTIKYRQQSFAARSMYDACRIIYKEGGVVAFLDGVSARGARIILATLVMSETRKKLNKLISNKP